MWYLLFWNGGADTSNSHPAKAPELTRFAKTTKANRAPGLLNALS